MKADSDQKNNNETHAEITSNVNEPIGNEQVETIQQPLVESDIKEIEQEEGIEPNKPLPAFESKKSVLGFSTDLKEYGKEQIIHIEPDQNMNDEHRINRPAYVFFQYYWFLVSIIVFCVSVIDFYRSQKHTFANLMISLIVVNVLKISINAVFFIFTRRQDREMNIVYFVNVLVSLGFISVYYGLYAFFTDKPFPYLVIFGIPYLLASTLNILLNWQRQLIYSESIFLRFMEAIQIILILASISNENTIQYKSSVDFYYSAIFFIIFVVIVIIRIMIVVLILTAVLGRNDRNTKLALLFFATLFFIADLFLGYLNECYIGLKKLMFKNVIGRGPYTGNDLDKTLLDGATGLLIISSIIVFLSSIFFIAMWRHIRNTLKNNSVEKISIVSFAKEMKLAVTKQSGTYYTEDKDFDKNKIGIEVNKNKQDCIICYDAENEVLVRPCGHSGFCKACMMDYIKTNKKCPHCKQQMDTLIVFYYDEEKGVNMAKEGIKLY